MGHGVEQARGEVGSKGSGLQAEGSVGALYVHGKLDARRE